MGVGVVCLLHCGWGRRVGDRGGGCLSLTNPLSRTLRMGNGGGGWGGGVVVSYIANHSLLIVRQVLAKLGPGGVVPDQVGVLRVAVEDLEQLHRPSPTQGN